MQTIDYCKRSPLSLEFTYGLYIIFAANVLPVPNMHALPFKELRV